MYNLYTSDALTLPQYVDFINNKPVLFICASSVTYAYGLSHFGGFCLRFQHAPGKFARGIVLQRVRWSFRRRKTVFCGMKGHRFKL